MRTWLTTMTLLVAHVSALSSALAEDQLPSQPFGGVCKYVGGGKTTFQQWHNSECLPVRCLRECAGYGSQLIEPVEVNGDERESVAAGLMRCALLCLDNDFDTLPRVGPDYPCRKRWPLGIDDSMNWLQNGQFCEATHQRACMYGRCLTPTEAVTRAISAFVEGREEYYLDHLDTTSDLQLRRYVYDDLARYYVLPGLLRAPGPLVTPDWKAIERQDYEKALAAEAARKAEEAAYKASEAARKAEAGERKPEESVQSQESTP